MRVEMLKQVVRNLGSGGRVTYAMGRTYNLDDVLAQMFIEDGSAVDPDAPPPEPDPLPPEMFEEPAVTPPDDEPAPPESVEEDE